MKTFSENLTKLGRATRRKVQEYLQLLEDAGLIKVVSPNRVDLFRDYKNCRVGFTIITLDEGFRRKLEPYSSTVLNRIGALEMLHAAGVCTYCSIEPIMSCLKSDPFKIVTELKPYVDLFEFGKWSPYVKTGIPVNYDEAYYAKLFPKLIAFCENIDVKYCIAVHSEKFLRSLDLKFVPHLHVTDLVQGE